MSVIFSKVKNALVKKEDGSYCSGSKDCKLMFSCSSRVQVEEIKNYWQKFIDR